MKKIFLDRNALFVCCLVILGIFVYGIIKNMRSDAPVRFLPFYGTTKYDTIKKGSSITIDTNYFHVPDFHFRAQDSSEVSEKNFAGSIYVVEYFFTTCPGICPVMNRNLEKVYEEFKGNPEIKFASFTVDPTDDSVPVMRSYAAKHDANVKQWFFMTGDKKDLYDLARFGFLMNVEPGDGGPADFIHTPQFVLVDKEGHIRGYYDGTQDREIEKMKAEINILLQTYSYYKNHAIPPPL
jgi:protein SCO1